MPDAHMGEVIPGDVTSKQAFCNAGHYRKYLVYNPFDGYPLADDKPWREKRNDEAYEKMRSKWYE